MDFEGKRATIIGLAREGTALARFLAEQGAIVTVSDLKSEEELQENITKLQGFPVHFVLGGHPGEILNQTDVLFLSPGVPLEAPIVAEAKRRGIPINSETGLFTELCPAPIIGITGSSGKTTTVSLVGQMLKASGFRTWVGGNIGQPLIGHLEEIEPTDKVVMELSSFQLEIMEWSPPIAAILNITPNHLDRHPSMEAYTEAKLNILRFQQPGDVVVLGYELQSSKLEAQSSKLKARILSFSLMEVVEQGAFLRDGQIILRLGDAEQRICSTDAIRLLGRHNLENVLAACTIAAAAGASRQAMADVATTFEGVEHRLELVRERDGVRYYNDSIATSPERTVAALRSFDRPIVLLAGGRDKHLPWDEMAQLTLQKARCLILFGEAASIIEEAIRVSRDWGEFVHRCQTLDEAVEMAAREAQPGDVVLLSPGGTSFDAFSDFVERGERFRELVKAL
ncbi:MAG: UDP-N-acetylmuramoyl-L-alanine--D-glutamate ligase [Anaerolineae bacterium]|nr:UDP-N-acetylmuramoyl-L-alanine--D-glutamate ligase [Anaerolineae bacterium]